MPKTLFYLLLGLLWLVEASLAAADTILPAHKERANQIIVSCDFCEEEGFYFYFDIIKAIYEPEGYRIVTRHDTFIRGAALIKEGKVDIIPTVFKLPEREALYTYPKIRFTTEYVSVLYHPDSIIKISDKLTGKVIKMRGYAYDNYIHEQANIEEVTRMMQGVKMVLNKRSDFFINPLMDTKTLIDELKEKHLIKDDSYQLLIMDELPTYLIFPPSNKGQQLADIYDRNIRKLFRSGKLEQIYQQHGFDKLYVYYPELK